MVNFFEVMLNTFFGLRDVAAEFWEFITTPLYQIEIFNSTPVAFVVWLLDLLGLDEANEIIAAFINLTLLEASLLALGIVYCIVCIVKWIIDIFR